jgi:LmbE family N-acetylglucosaminyl deacetylase
MRVLAVGAHPDDIEILCSGTLFRCRQRGDQVILCIVTDGAAGHAEIPPDELKGIRKDEAQAAADMLGAELIWLGLPDERVYDDDLARMMMVDAVRKAAPDMIISHFSEDYHHDHRTVSKLVYDASFIASLPNIPTEHEPHSLVPVIYEMDTLAGVGFLPEEYVDISDVLSRKLEMLACHETQVRWLKDHDRIDILDFVTTVAKFRGLQCGAAFAEGFRLKRAWPRIPARRLLP